MKRENTCGGLCWRKVLLLSKYQQWLLNRYSISTLLRPENNSYQVALEIYRVIELSHSQ